MIIIHQHDLHPAVVRHHPATETYPKDLTVMGVPNDHGIVNLFFRDLDDAAEWLRGALGQVEVAKINSVANLTPAKLADL